MAAKVVTLQKADGYWPASLLDNDPGTPPESSGTAFSTYAFAWGVDNGLLDRTTYEPAAVRGWGALGRAVPPDGTHGWGQQVGDRLDSVPAKAAQLHGSGPHLPGGTAQQTEDRRVWKGCVCTCRSRWVAAH